jgi:hypothetical protein
MPRVIDAAELAEIQADIAAHPFYVASLADGFPYGDDYDAEVPEEGPVFYTHLSDAQGIAAQVHEPAGVFIRTAADGYPDPADPRADVAS